MMLLELCQRAVEVIGALALEAIGLTNFIIFSTAAATLSLATVVGTAILVAGSIGLSLLLNRARPLGGPPGVPSLPSPEAGHQPLRQATPPRIVGYGRVRLAGSYVLFEAYLGVSYDAVALHHGRISAFVGYYLHDDVVTIDGFGIVDVQGDGRYGANSITIKTRLGADTETAYSEITSALPTIWTSAHRGDGLASLALICQPVANIQDFPTIYPRQKPEPSVVADCTPIFDPRDDDQARDDVNSWAVSSNPVLQLIDFLTNSDRGMGFDWNTLIAPVLSELMAQADICDELVLKADNSLERRYASNGSFPLDADPVDVISTILDTCDGWLSEKGDGALVLIVGRYIEPGVALQSKHIRGAQLQYGVADEEIVNELTIDYTEPQADYKTLQGAPWRNEADIAERGRVRSQRFALPWVYSHSQARRLAKRRDAQNNAILRGTITTTLYGLQARGDRWVRVSAPEISADLTDIAIEVRGITIDLLNAQCVVKFVSVNPNSIDAWNEDTEEGAAPTIPAKLVFPPAPTPQNPGAIPFDEGPQTGHARFIIYFDDPGRSDLTFQAAWRLNGTGDPFVLGPIAASINTPGIGKPGVYGGQTIGFLGVPTTYEVKVRSFAPAGPASAFSSTTTVVVNPGD